MKVKLYGTRGSISVSGPDKVKYGGNTTSLRVISQCLPAGEALVVDAGSGYVPLCVGLLREKVLRVSVLFTHYHHDHTIGVELAPHTFIPAAEVRVWGPKENGVGPGEVLEGLMAPPCFPVAFARVRHRFRMHNLENIGTQVLVIHPEGGFLIVPVHVFEQAEAGNGQLSFGRRRFPIGESLVVRMYKASHPEYVVSYRFEERPTGRVFVFLTDHEVTASFPRDLVRHLTGAHLLVQDGQYSQARYDRDTAGFGHGTPEYCVKTAIAAGVTRLGLTHHDPGAIDDDVDQRLQEAKAFAEGVGNHDLQVFACADYQELEV